MRCFFWLCVGILASQTKTETCVNGMFSEINFDTTYFNRHDIVYFGGDFEIGVQNYQEWIESGSICYSCSETGPRDDFLESAWSSQGFLPSSYYSASPLLVPFMDITGKHEVVMRKIQLANNFGPSSCMCPENNVYIHDLMKYGYLRVSDMNVLKNLLFLNPQSSEITLMMKRYWNKMKLKSIVPHTVSIMKNNPCLPCPPNSRSARGAMVYSITNVNTSVDETLFGACACNSGYEYQEEFAICRMCALGHYSTQTLTILTNSYTDSVHDSSVFNNRHTSKTIEYTNELIQGHFNLSFVFDFSGQIRRTGAGRKGAMVDTNVVYVNQGCMPCPEGTTTYKTGAQSPDECVAV